MSCQTQEPILFIYVCKHVYTLKSSSRSASVNKTTTLRQQQLNLFQNLEVKKFTHNPQVARLFEAGCVKKMIKYRLVKYNVKKRVL